MKTIRVAIGQINSVVGDLNGNASKIIENCERAALLGADIVAFPEMVLTGYPPEDLLANQSFINDTAEALERIQDEVSDVTAIVGYAEDDGALYDSAAIISGGKILGSCRKLHMPNPDDSKYFAKGNSTPVLRIGDTLVGITIGEDMWFKDGPLETLNNAGVGLVLNLNADPFIIGRMDFRETMAANYSKRTNAAIAYVNLMGGQDEYIFDGGSFVMDAKGVIISRASRFTEDFLVTDIKIPFEVPDIDATPETAIPIPHQSADAPKIVHAIAEPLSTESETYSALCLAMVDYVEKNDFAGAIVGLSGGIDSALCAAIAVDALGNDAVRALCMPSEFSSDESNTLAHKLAANLGINIDTIPITPAFEALKTSLAPIFDGAAEDTTEENLQARVRGNLLMGVSNKLGLLVISTGNKSEASMGYATLYGDMVGGYSLIKDLSKEMVYKLANWRNTVQGAEVIPAGIINREPTAELAHGQKDSDSLPPYAILDPILKSLIEDTRSFDECMNECNCSPEILKQVVNMISSSEYKRRQAAPGPRLTGRALGTDWALPSTNRYRGQ